MERLTKLAKNGGKYVSAIGSGHGCWGRIISQLAAYEDTGLTPEEINEILHDTTGPLHKKLGEWMKAESEGRLVVLPCKVGDTVYRIFAPDGREPVISAHTLLSVDSIVRWMNKFGKTVFLTREEAEAALQKEEAP